MSKPGITPAKGRKPLTRKISGKSLALAVDGQPEQPYPVYQFSRRHFFERPGHNPFSSLGGSGDSAWGDSWDEGWGDSWNV